MDFKPAKILVIRLGAVGDIIRTLPAVKILKDNFPAKLEIHWLAEKHNSNILNGLSYIDKIIKIPRKEWQKQILSIGFYKVFVGFAGLIKQLRSENYDFVIDFHGILKSGILSLLTGANTRIGYSRKYSKECNFLFNNRHIDLRSGRITRIEKNFAALAFFFGGRFNEIPDNFGDILEIKNPEKNKIDKFLVENGISNRKLIGINPAVSKFGQYKEWREDYYSRLCELISERYANAALIMTWGPGEYDKIQRIIAGISKTKNLFVAPDTTMRELAYLISRMDLFITGDTGPMHLASILSTPIVALFGPSDPIINAPFGKHNIVLFKETGCNPCRNRKCRKLICQSELTPEFVFSEIEKTGFNKIFD